LRMHFFNGIVQVVVHLNGIEEAFLDQSAPNTAHSIGILLGGLMIILLKKINDTPVFLKNNISSRCF